MALKDYTTGLTNKILIGTGGIGLIIAGVTGLSRLTPAHQVVDPSNNQVSWYVNLKGDSTQSGAIASKTLTAGSCDVKGSSTGMLYCGVDLAGGATGVNSGGVIQLADGRYVNTSGDTMTGALTINLTSGYIGLKVIQTGSGNIFHADKALTSSGLLIVKSRNKRGSGAVTIIASNHQSGAYIYGSGGTNLVLDSNTAPGILFGYRGIFDTNLYREQVSRLRTDGTFVANTTLASSGTLVWEGAASGSSLYVATSLNGVGLTNCTSATQFLQWNSTTGRFLCGNVSPPNTFGSGNVVALGDPRYVNIAGDTMTGALIINSNGGTTSNVLLNTLGTMSGRSLAIWGTGTVWNLHTPILYTDTSHGRVAINNAAPTALLSFGQFPSGTNVLDFFDNGSQKMGFGVNNSEFQIYYPTSNHISFNRGGQLSSAPGVNEVVRITALGQLLVGTTIADGQLDVLSYTDPTIALNTGTGSNNPVFKMGNSAQGGRGKITYEMATDSMTFGVSPSGNLASVEAMRILRGGNIGMGTTTPGSKLSVSGSVIINPNGNLSNAAADTKIALEIIGTASGRTVYAQQALRSSGSLIWDMTASGNVLKVQKDISGSGALFIESGAYINGTTLNVITGLNRVGIGTASPKTKLEVAGTMSGTGLGVNGNVTMQKMMSGSSVIDYSLTTANTCTDNTVTVKGAAINDLAMLAVPNAGVPAGGGYFIPWVSSANTVTIRFCSDGTGRNPGSAIYNVIVEEFR